MNANKFGVLIVALGWLSLLAAITLFRPLMPVDETRYLTVAWEMMVRGDWVLPTLNFHPYSHKPPLIFWLIHATWEIFGVSVTGARMVILSAVAALLALSARLARDIYGRRDIGLPTILLMCAMPAYLVYGSVIMFDSLLAVFVVGAMIILWRAGKMDDRRHWIALGFIMGFGILAKGPVALVYILPAALFAPLWIQDRIIDWRRWYLGILSASMLAIATGLAWSMPAALQGGLIYAERIFVSQSTGRMVDAFDHVEPFWFYIPVMTGFLLPFLVWPTVWSAVRQKIRSSERGDQATRFLLCWIIPSLLFFSAISGKSIHYVIPFLPGIIIFLSGILSAGPLAKPQSVCGPILVLALPSALALIFKVHGIQVDGFILDTNGIYLCIAHLCLSAGILAWVRRGDGRVLQAMSISAFLAVIVILAQLGQGFFKPYDLTPVAQEIQQYKERPIATAPKYDGEYGFTARMEKSVLPIGREHLPWWFHTYPDGVVIGRYENTALPDPAYYTLLFQQPFRKTETIVIFEKKPGAVIPGSPRNEKPSGKWWSTPEYANEKKIYRSGAMYYKDGKYIGHLFKDHSD